MANSSVIGALRVSLGLETASFDKGLDRSKGKLSSFDRDTRKMASGVSGLGRELGAGLGPVGTVLDKIGAAGLVAGVGVGAAVVAFQGMRDALKFADDLDATATKIGVTAEQFQELTFAAHENDITTEALSQSLQGLNVSLGAYKAGVGDAKVKKIFEALGITRESLKDVNNAAEFLPMLADKIRGLQSTAERVKIAKALGVEDMVPLLSKGGAEIDRLAAKARELGLVMSNDLTSKAADANRELEVMGEYIKAHLSIAFADMGVWVVDLTKKLGPMIDRINKATKAWENFITGGGARDPQDLPGFVTGGQLGAAVRQRNLERSRGPKRPPGRTGGSGTPQGPGGLGGYRPDAEAPDAPSGGGGGSSRSHTASKPRFNGALPGYIQDAIKQGRFTEASIREAYPDGNFPLPDLLAQDLIYADTANAYDANGPINVRAVDQNPELRTINDATAAIDATKAQNQEAFREMFTGGLLAALHDGKDGVREWMRQGAERGLEQALNNLADVLFKLFSDAMSGGVGGGSGIGSTIGSFLSSAFGGGGGATPAFATGGSFTVGGSGGMDSKLVQFRATPGEMVNIKHGNDNGPGGGVVVHVEASPYFDARVEQVASPISARHAAQVYGQVKGEQAQAAKAQRYRVAR